MNLIKLKVILLAASGCFLSILMFDINIILQSLLFLVFVLVLMFLYQKKGILHPLSWYPMLFFLYSVSYPLYMYLYYLYGHNYPVVNEIIPICFIALLSFVFSFLLLEKEVDYNVTFKHYDKSLKVVGWLLILFCNSISIFILLSGISSKREFLNLVEAYNISFLFVSFFLLSLINALVVKNDIERYGKIKLNLFLIVSILTFFLVFGITGERDLLFRFLLLIFLITFSFWLKYEMWKFCLGLALFILILPLTQQLKSFFVSSTVELKYNDGDYLNSEFASAGRNLLYLMERNINEEGWSIFMNDIYRYFNFLGTKELSATAWFNEVIRYQYGDGGVSGWGFSLVGEGYAAFGLYGVIGLFLFLGIVTAIIHNFVRNKFIFCMYMLYIPVMIYVIRADLSNFLSLNFKVNLVVVSMLFSVLYFLSFFSRNKTQGIKKVK